MLGGLLDQHVHFLAGHFDAIGLADFGKEQAQTHAALRDAAIIVALVFHFLHCRFGIFGLSGFLLQLGPDLFEFGIDHGLRHGEIVARGKLVEQLALHLGARQAVGFLLDLGAQQFLQLVQPVEAEILREIVVDLGVGFDLHLLDRDVEFGILAGEMRGLVIFGEGDGDGLLIARLHARQLLFEAGDELARTEHQRGVLGGAAFEFFAIHAADEIDDQLVAIGGLLALRRVLVALIVAGELLQHLVDLLVSHRHRQAFQLQAIDIGRVDLGQHFEFDRQLGILALIVAFVELDLGLHRRAQFLFAHQLVDRFADHVVDGLRVHLLAVHLAHQIRRDLAGAEAGHADLRGDLLDLAPDTRIDVLGGDRQRVGALEAFIGRLGNLHGNGYSRILSIGLREGRPVGGGWCGRRDSNPHIFRYWYLKPARLPIPPRPQSARNTNEAARQQPPARV